MIDYSSWWYIQLSPDGHSQNSRYVTLMFETEDRARKTFKDIFSLMEDYEVPPQTMPSIIYKVSDDTGLSYIVDLSSRTVEMFNNETAYQRKEGEERTRDSLKAKYQYKKKVGQNIQGIHSEIV